MWPDSPAAFPRATVSPDGALVVLQVSASVARRDGGPSTVVLELNRHLLAQGIASRVVTTDADGRGRLTQEERRDVLVDASLAVDLHRMHAPRRLKTSFGMAYSINTLLPVVDVVHIHGIYLFHSAVSAWLCRWHGVPYVVQPHGNLEPYQRKTSRLVKGLYDRFAGDWVLGNAARVVFADESEAVAARDRVPAIRAAVSPLGARLDPPLPAAQWERWRTQVTAQPYVLFLGRLAAKKRVDLLLQAWPAVLRERPELALVVAGDGDRALVERLRLMLTPDLAQRVHLVGAVQGGLKTSLLQHAEAFVLPSENENFAISVAEALVAGLPVVTTRHVAAHRYVVEYEAGVIIEELSAGAVATALLTAVSDRGGALRRGAEQAAGALTWEVAARRAAALYREVRSAAPGRDGA